MACLREGQQDLSVGFRNVQLFRKEELGHGSYGFVCKAQCDQLICAAKIIYRALRQTVEPDQGREHRQPNRRFKSEIEFLKQVHHPNIVQYLGTYEDLESGDLVLLMELMDESLTHFLDSSLGDILYHTQVNLSYDIAQALAFLHANGIIHRDLSSNNVLIQAGTRAKVTDFGMSKFTDGLSASMTLSPGTPAYMSPEALNQPPVYTEKLDIFSFGVQVVQILTKKFPEPTKRFETQDLLSAVTNQVITAQVPIPEVERRHGHISLIQQHHPLLLIALDCLKDRGQERPSSQDLCKRLNTLKSSDSYKESPRQDTACSLREDLQGQSQKHRLVLNRDDISKDQQILNLQEQNDRLQNQNQQQLEEIDQLVARIEQITQLQLQEQGASASAPASKELEWQLQALQEKLMVNEQDITTLQQILAQRDTQVSELREMLATEKRANLTETDPIQHQATQVRHSTADLQENVQSSEGLQIAKWESFTTPIEISAGSSAAIGDIVYIKSEENQTIHQYSSSTREWSILPKHPINGFTLVNIENTLTTVGGKSFGVFGMSYSSKVYSCKQGKWNEVIPEMPTRRSKPGAVYKNNTLVVSGGYNGRYLSTIEIYNTTNRQWYGVSSMPFRTSQPTACIHGSNIYIHAGTGNLFSGMDFVLKRMQQGFASYASERHSVLKCSLASLEHSGPSSEVWERIASLPVRGSTLISVNGYLLAVGGDDSGPTNNVYQYNETTDSWTVASRMHTGRHHCLTALLPCSKLIVVGGDNSEAHKSIEIATIKH